MKSTNTEIGISTTQMEWMKIPSKATTVPKTTAFLEEVANTRHPKWTITHAREIVKIASGAQYAIGLMGAQIIKNGAMIAETRAVMPIRTM
jgi:hypothetical protein